MSYSIETIADGLWRAISDDLYCLILCADLTPGPHFSLRQHLLPQGLESYACLEPDAFAMTLSRSFLSGQLLSPEQLVLLRAHTGIDGTLALVASARRVPRRPKLHTACILSVSTIVY